MVGERFAGPMQLAAHCVRGLFGEFADLVVAQLLVGHQQQQEAIFLGKLFQGLLIYLVYFRLVQVMILF
jgi:hypothetical protein